MKKYFPVFSFLLPLLFFVLVLPAGAQQYIDPILLDKPNARVFPCGEDLFFEILENARIASTISGCAAKERFLYFGAEFLYLQEDPWNGVDRGSFTLKQVSANGTEVLYPLNYMVTMKIGMNNGWKILSDQQTFATLMNLTLVFDIPLLKTTTGFSLLFRPAERGGEAVCEVEIPLKVSN